MRIRHRFAMRPRTNETQPAWPSRALLQPHRGQLIQKKLTPLWSALSTRREIAGLAGPWVAKPHGQNGELLAIIERIPVYTQPAAESLAARVIERHP